MFARTGQPSYAGITNEIYLGLSDASPERDPRGRLANQTPARRAPESHGQARGPVHRGAK